jgi:hypothetical protein
MTYQQTLVLITEIETNIFPSYLLIKLLLYIYLLLIK